MLRAAHILYNSKKKVTMIYWITVKRLNKKRLKRLNEILECHMEGVHALSHKVFAFIYIYIYIYIDIDCLCLFGKDIMVFY